NQAHPRDRRLGTRLLFELSESSPRLHQGMVERRKLGGGFEELLNGGTSSVSSHFLLSVQTQCRCRSRVAPHNPSRRGVKALSLLPINYWDETELVPSAAFRTANGCRRPAACFCVCVLAPRPHNTSHRIDQSKGYSR